ncbi:AMIN-like domain-containing (lipo)protein [Vallicoccus soli]|uniref:AMIN-like domain-containing protein n=1 Tax=Vallicoccus soli TaxID=2339232 RepID=A0A3A3YWW5_9ACTN|nr:hypothetical protein [Vallicoccus soli]RJK94758.1 hypothetical protein D5H78_13045 [Vallicoccus soli]
MHRLPCALAATALAGAVALVAPPAAAAPYCGITWGSLHQQAPDYQVGSVTDVRSGRHACFDRLVVDVAGLPQGFSVRYVPVVRAPGSGAAVPVAGGARLEVTVWAPAYDEGSGEPTYLPRDRRHVVDVAGYRTFRQVAWAGSFEAGTTLALGVRARLPVRAFALPGPGDASRVVLDVAHRW